MVPWIAYLAVEQEDMVLIKIHRILTILDQASILHPLNLDNHIHIRRDLPLCIVCESNMRTGSMWTSSEHACVSRLLYKEKNLYHD